MYPELTEATPKPSSTSRYDNLFANLSAEKAERQRKKLEREEVRIKQSVPQCFANQRHDSVHVKNAFRKLRLGKPLIASLQPTPTLTSLRLRTRRRQTLQTRRGSKRTTRGHPGRGQEP
ncbi:hypothetical protein BC936DRAFT_145472 [Jimgerdemannia flammicorona]|uniref:Uncharacterized protein n=1 Tax=Jimgerdemannia flammicorona TaxID=994334 RepID=A0A433D9W7_9FUNG|nr:hypothetical protein BC936DRAFT_145472 [Jimgerdemannia flammicorona]